MAACSAVRPRPSTAPRATTGSFADSFEGSDYSDPAVQSSNAGRPYRAAAGRRYRDGRVEHAGTAAGDRESDAQLVVGRDGKLLVKMGLRIPGDSLNTTANEMNNDATRSRRRARPPARTPRSLARECTSQRPPRRRQRSPVTRRVIGVLALSLVLAGCGAGAATGASERRSRFRTPRSTGCCSTAAEVNAIMGTNAMKPHPVVTADGRPPESASQSQLSWRMAGQRGSGLRPDATGSRCANSCFGNRTPTSGTPSSCSPSSRTGRPTRRATSSRSRWTDGRKCTNHHVNIRLNDQPLPAWLSGDLTKTDTELSMPFTRGSGAADPVVPTRFSRSPPT